MGIPPASGWGAKTGAYRPVGRGFRAEWSTSPAERRREPSVTDRHRGRISLANHRPTLLLPLARAVQHVVARVDVLLGDGGTALANPPIEAHAAEVLTLLNFVVGRRGRLLGWIEHGPRCDAASGDD